ncbi:hypothetical protein [Streptomyces sp. NBC_00557]|nr:hypothetical protein [Streptomyces sp. NBC_00557]WUC40126.1 hypothetical protein OG956_22105 [Streptomyces sp. NBC_00557]
MTTVTGLFVVPLSAVLGMVVLGEPVTADRIFSVRLLPVAVVD